MLHLSSLVLLHLIILFGHLLISDDLLHFLLVELLPQCQIGSLHLKFFPLLICVLLLEKGVPLNELILDQLIVFFDLLIFKIIERPANSGDTRTILSTYLNIGTGILLMIGSPVVTLEVRLVHFLLPVLFHGPFEFILVEVLECVLVVLTGMVANLDFVDHIGVNMLSDELPVMLGVGIVDAIHLTVSLHLEEYNYRTIF